MTTTVASTASRTRPVEIVLAWALAAGFAILPVLRGVFVVSNGAADISFPDAGDVAALEAQAIFGGFTFLLLGGALIALVVAIRGRQRAGSPAALGGLIAGAAGGIGLVLAGIQAREQFSWISANLAEITDDRTVQAAALWAVNIDSITGLDLAVLGAAAWTALITVEGSTVGRGWGWAAAAVAVVLVVAKWGLALPAAQYLYVPFFLLLAIGLTVARRRVAQSARDA